MCSAYHGIVRAMPASSETPVMDEPLFEIAPASAPPADSKPRETPEAPPATREATAADIDRLETLTLEDFAADFSKVELPEGPLSEGDLSRAVESFIDSLKER